MEVTPSMVVYTKAVRPSSLNLCLILTPTITRMARIHPSTLSRHSQEDLLLYGVTGPDIDHPIAPRVRDMTHSAHSAYFAHGTATLSCIIQYNGQHLIITAPSRAIAHAIALRDAISIILSPVIVPCHGAPPYINASPASPLAHTTPPDFFFHYYTLVRPQFPLSTRIAWYSSLPPIPRCPTYTWLMMVVPRLSSRNNHI
jgi:hypothetical protein